MPRIPCANFGTELAEPASVTIIHVRRMSSGPVPNIAWLCESCYEAFPPAAKASWRHYEPAPPRKVGWFQSIRRRLTEHSTSKSTRYDR